MSTLVATPKPPAQPKPPKPPKSPTFTPPRPPRPQNTLRKLAMGGGYQASAPKSPAATTNLKTAPKPLTPHATQSVTPAIKPLSPQPQQPPQPQQNNFMGSALKGLIPWKTVLQGGLPMVAGLSGLLRGQNTLAPLFEGPDNASKTAAYKFGQRVHLESKPRG